MNDPRERDLFGHPVRPGKGGRGRPSKELTENELDELEAGLVKGWTNARIAEVVGVSLSTLKRNFGPLLKQRPILRDKLQLSMFAVTARKALSGDMTAMRQLDRMVEKDLLAGMEQKIRDAQSGKKDGDDDEAHPGPKLGKKEAAQLAAETAGEDTGWGSDLNPGTLN